MIDHQRGSIRRLTREGSRDNQHGHRHRPGRRSRYRNYLTSTLVVSANQPIERPAWIQLPVSMANTPNASTSSGMYRTPSASMHSAATFDVEVCTPSAFYPADGALVDHYVYCIVGTSRQPDIVRDHFSSVHDEEKRSLGLFVCESRVSRWTLSWSQGDDGREGQNGCWLDGWVHDPSNANERC